MLIVSSVEFSHSAISIASGDAPACIAKIVLQGRLQSNKAGNTDDWDGQRRGNVQHRRHAYNHQKPLSREEIQSILQARPQKVG